MTNTRLSNKLKRKSWRKRNLKGIRKALTNSWDGDLDDDSACVGFAHAQKRPGKTVSSDTG